MQNHVSIYAACIMQKNSLCTMQPTNTCQIVSSIFSQCKKVYLKWMFMYSILYTWKQRRGQSIQNVKLQLNVCEALCNIPWNVTLVQYQVTCFIWYACTLLGCWSHSYSKSIRVSFVLGFLGLSFAMLCFCQVMSSSHCLLSAGQATWSCRSRSPSPTSTVGCAGC